MTEPVVQLITEKYKSEFIDPALRENMKTPVHVPAEISNSQSFIQKSQARRSSAKPSATSPPKSQPIKYFNSLTDKQKTEAYFDLYDQNLQLRSKQNDLESQIKKLTTQLMRLTKDIKPGINNELEQKNEELLLEIKNLKMKLAAKLKNNRPGVTKSKNFVPKAVEKYSIAYEADIREREEIIQLLRDQLEATETELLRAQANKVQLPDLSLEFKEKAYRLAEVENKFIALEENVNAQKIYIQHLTSMLEDSKKALIEERFKNCEMEIQVKAAEMAASGAQDLALKLKSSEAEKAQLEIRIKEIIEAYFALEANKSDNPIHFPSPGIGKLPI